MYENKRLSNSEPWEYPLILFDSTIPAHDYPTIEKQIAPPSCRKKKQQDFCGPKISR
jgi:hypothetical protein